MKHSKMGARAGTVHSYLRRWLLLALFVIVHGSASSSGWTARLVKDIDPADDSHPRLLTQVDNTLFFTVHGRELWKSDGTAAGTIKLKDILPSDFPDYPMPLGLTNMNGTLLFFESDLTTTWLGKSDGTPAGTVRIKACGGGYPTDNVVKSGNLLWFATGGETKVLWKSDGTASGTVQVKSFTFGGRSVSSKCLAVYRGLLYLVVKGDGDAAWQLWRSNGTAGGTTLVKDLPCRTSDSISPYDAYVINDRLLFFTENAVGAMGLWSSDGTDAGTQLIMQRMTTGWQYWFCFNFDGWLSIPSDLDPWSSSVSTGNAVVFGVYDDSSTSVWKTDGTPAGTVKLMDIGGVPSDSFRVFPVEFTDTGDGVDFFVVSRSDIHQFQYTMWKIDASLQHATQLKAFAAHSANYPFDELTSVTYIGATLFFGLNEGDGNRIWISDGTPAGTTCLNDVDPVPRGCSAWYFTGVNGRVFCSAGSTANGQELWVCAPALPPTAAFTATPTSGPAPLTVQFTDLSSPGVSPITNWEWNFGDGLTSHDQSPLHVYDADGAYTVTLTVTSADGVDVASRTWCVDVGDVLPATTPVWRGLLTIILLVAGTGALYSCQRCAG
jgi:ELWxxDGT repeat protein